MGRIKERMEPVKLIMSILFAQPELEGPVLQRLERELGKVQIISGRTPFHHTDYYKEEMGPGLYRRMVCFRGLFPEDSLVRTKLLAMSIEDYFRNEEGKRRANLDPGTLGLGRLVLSTHKDHAHRVFLGRGVYADLTLVFTQGRFRPLPWTYPDYASEPLLGWVHKVRGLLLWERRRLKEEGVERGVEKHDRVR